MPTRSSPARIRRRCGVDLVRLLVAMACPCGVIQCPTVPGPSPGAVLQAGPVPSMVAMGRGEVKTLSDHPGNRTVPQIFAREGFGGGVLPARCPAILSGPDQAALCGVDLVRLLVATACPVA
jgi:hypothetical protein